MDATGPFPGRGIENRNANATLVSLKQTQTMLEQITIENARDTLRSTGDTAPC
jgi:hypothetical protein